MVCSLCGSYTMVCQPVWELYHGLLACVGVIPWLLACVGDNPLTKVLGLPCTGGQTVVELLHLKYTFT